jgi:hypothetical protein
MGGICVSGGCAHGRIPDDDSGSPLSCCRIGTNILASRDGNRPEGRRDSFIVVRGGVMPDRGRRTGNVTVQQEP